MSRVKAAIAAGYTELCDGFAAAMWFRFNHRRGDYRQLVIRTEQHTIELCISPTGRSQQVFVNGVKVDA